MSHGDGKSYAIGFVLSLVLTAVPFALVMTGALPRSTVLPGILVLAVLQILVHLVFFLHMNTRSEGGWNVLALGLTVLITVIVVVGSIWIMQHLDHNMMMVPGLDS
jgi:cytochrome o ubiquinol oxidase subunit IV